ncbi:unnamed protein product [Cuscuta epithymum]|uniref:J domain-containing protein n=1 Tax=Cuscuta epithymum TaxID=186058 RepID=A0AAV0E9G9_9ASTE|nr:unnamed protein product [Cuscuta epithymum]
MGVMARKGGQVKHGFNSHLGNTRKEHVDSGSRLPDKTKGNDVSDPNVITGEEHLSGNLPSVPLTHELNSSSQPEAKRKNKHKHGKSLKKEKQDAVASAVTEHVEAVGELDSHHSHKTDASELREGKETPFCNDYSSGDPKSRASSSVEGTATRETIEKSVIIVFRYLGTIAISISNSCIEWIERRKPWLRHLKCIVSNASVYARRKAEQAYPVALKWIVSFGNILLLLSMVWLDCCLRGMGSFLCMGTTSLFSFMWWGVLSLIAVSGFKFILILLGVSVIALLSGFIVAILALSFIGVAFLWLYGHFFIAIPVILCGGVLARLNHERIAVFIVTLYSVYCGRTHVGWLGLLLGLNLSFISSDALIFFLKNNLNERRSDSYPEQMAGVSADFGGGLPADHSTGGIPSTSESDSGMTSENEVIRLLNCADHYSALGLSRFQDVDVSILKREYKRKAMLVHPDKNMGNERAVEAFKKLQNAYEVLFDSLKRKTYDEELKRQDFLNYFRSFQTTSQKNRGRKFTQAEGVGEEPLGESRRINCKKCGKFHLWICTERVKYKARWCQECEEFHQAKDGDGWVEQTSQPFLYGLLVKVETPCAYVCAESKIYDATEWYTCQGMRCPANSHKPSFHVNTNVTLKSSNGKRNSSTTSGRRGGMPNMEDAATMSEEEFAEWLQNALQGGLFNNGGGSGSSQSPAAAETGKGSGSNTSGNKKKKKGKKQW